jgi:hypothetical protein
MSRLFTNLICFIKPTIAIRPDLAYILFTTLKSFRHIYTNLMNIVDVAFLCNPGPSQVGWRTTNSAVWSQSEIAKQPLSTYSESALSKNGFIYQTVIDYGTVEILRTKKTLPSIDVKRNNNKTTTYRHWLARRRWLSEATVFLVSVSLEMLVSWKDNLRGEP